MAEGRSVGQESLEDKEGRLVRELEELKRAERVRKLEHELAELRAKQKIKELEYQLEERKRAEEVRRLERQVEDVQNRSQVTSEPSCGDAATRVPDTQPSPKTDHSHGPVSVESATCDDTQEAHRSVPTLLATTSSDAAQTNPSVPDRHTESSISSALPPNLSPVMLDHHLGFHDTVQRDPGASTGLSGIGTNTGPSSVSSVGDAGLGMDALTLQYYQELDAPADDSPELLFYDMDLEQLYDFTSTLEENAEKGVGDVKLLSRVYYFIFTRTRAADDIQKAIQKAEEVVEATHADNPNYAPCLRDLVVMLLKKHEHTSSLEDLDRAILLAEVMITVTPSFHPDRSDRLMDLVKMKFKRYRQSGLPENLNDATAMAIEAMGMVQGAGDGQVDRHLDWFHQTGDLNDSNMAVNGTEEAVGTTPHDHPNRAAMLIDLASSRHARFKQTNDLDDLDMLIRADEEVVAAIPHEHPARAVKLSNLTISLRTRFNRTGHLDDLHTAIKRNEEAVALTPHRHPERQARLSDLANDLHTKFKREGDPNDVHTAIKWGEEALATIPRKHPNRAAILNTLANILHTRFERMGDLNDLHKAIRRGEEAVESTPTQHPDRAVRLGNLVAYLHTKYKRKGDLSDLHTAIDRGEEAVATIPQGHPDSAGPLINLSNALHTLSTMTGDLSDLHMAISRGEEAVAAIPVDHPSRAVVLSNLAFSLWTRFKRTGNLNNLHTAIRRGEEAVAATSHHDPDMVGRLGNLAAYLHTRFERAGDLCDLHTAIEKGEEALAKIPHDHPDRAVQLGNLAGYLHAKAERGSDIDDLRIAIKRGEEAVATIPLDHPDKASPLVNLANALHTLSTMTGDLNDLHMAISRGEEAVAGIPDDHSGKAAALSTLANALRARFEQTGDLYDLNAAIIRLEEAVASENYNHSDMARWLGNLAASLHTRFERTGDIYDLHMAIENGEKAIAASPLGHQARVAMLSNLAGSLRARFTRMDDLDDLHMAIRRGEEAVAAMSPDNKNRATALTNLAFCLRTRSERTGNLSDLSMAINRGEEAVAVASHDHPARPVFLTNLAVSLCTRFARTRSFNDLQMAIQRSEVAIAETPHNHPDRARWLSNLANFLYNRFNLTNSWDDFERAADLWMSATELRNAPPRDRIKSGFEAAERLADKGKWAEASRITEIAVNLLPTVAPRQLKQYDQQHMLEEFAGLAALAASAALEAGKDASHTVQLLELGRGIITGLRFGLRSDLTELKEQHPDMAEKFEQLRNILDSPSSDTLDPFRVGGFGTSASGTNQRHNAGLELEEIVNQIRRLPNFENFLRPLQTHQLMAAASQGPVVLINVSEYRCDALVVETQAIRSIRLSDLRQSEIRKYVELMKSIRSAHTSSSDATSQVSRMLEWLWDVVVGPILGELGFTEPPSGDNWPHVWWIPTGQLSLLPLHAAGRHYPLSTETTLDRVISSYSPSIKALLYAGQNSQRKNPSSASEMALLVSMDTTPGHSDLRFAREEVEKLASILPDRISTVTLELPLRETVLSALNTCTVFHFAGHGESHPSDPSKSSLLVTDWDKTPLTVEDLIGLNLSQKPPCLAYLSACSTSESQAENLHDEAIHLVTACQLAGFQHVVGSLWEVSDRYSVHVAEEVYKTMLDGGAVDGTRIALGVHKAVRRLRDVTQERGEERFAGPSESGEEVSLESSTRTGRRVRPLGYEERDTSDGSDPLIWAAYIHVGL